MKPIEGSFEPNSCLLAENMALLKPRQFGRALSEEDILYLQDIFLSNGLHAIKLPNIIEGRSLIYRLLQSLHYYRTVACLTSVAEPPLKKSIFDIHSALRMLIGDRDAIEDFFMERFFVDFLWIELTPDLVQVPTFMQVMSALDVLAIDKHIPILTLSYDS
jgi:hypothetical protein